MSTNREFTIEADKGDFEPFTFVYSDASGDPVDLTNYTAEMVVYWG